MRQPSLNKVTLPFGATTPPYSLINRHSGTDYSYSPDPYSYAPEAVRVTFVRNTNVGACGKMIDFESLDGSRKYRFCHSSEIYVKTGQTVSEGFKMAKMGATGQASGAHLHCVLFVNGNLVDPYATLKALTGTDMPDRGTIINAFKAANERDPTEAEIAAFIDKTINDPKGLFYNKLQADLQNKNADIKAKQKRIEELEAQVGTPPVVLNSGVYKVN